MKLLWITLALGLPLAVARGAQMAKSTPTPEDPYLWLEDISGEKALNGSRPATPNPARNWPKQAGSRP